MTALIFCAIALTLHCLKKSRLSSLWAMLLNVILLPSSAVSAVSIFFGIAGFFSIAAFIGTVGCLLIFIYQNISPSDPLSFGKNYSEKAEHLVGGRRLIISGAAASTWGMISALSGIIAICSADMLFFGLEGENLRAATIATMGLNAILGMIGALLSFIHAAVGTGRIVCGEIMLINGLLRNVRELYKNSGKAAALSVLSCIPIINAVCAVIVLKKSQGEIKRGTITQIEGGNP